MLKSLIEKFKTQNCIIHKPGYYLFSSHSAEKYTYCYLAWGSFPGSIRYYVPSREVESDPFYEDFKEITLIDFLLAHTWYRPEKFHSTTWLSEVFPNFPWTEFEKEYIDHSLYPKINWKKNPLLDECPIMRDVLKKLGLIA